MRVYAADDIADTVITIAKGHVGTVTWLAMTTRMVVIASRDIGGSQ